MKCPRCQTRDPRYFAKIQGRYYCRRCIQFGRIFVDEPLKSSGYEKNDKHVYYALEYELSKRQREISDRLVENYNTGKNSIVLAVCGSGKTEIVYDVMVTALNKQQRVCFAVPRKTLVVELGERIKKQFKGIEPALFYGGKSGDESSLLIICTTHQLYRFNKTFDLLILDEIDAFPYRHNALLEDLLYQSIRGHYVFMSATLDGKDFPDGELLILNRRYHDVDLPVPKWQSTRFFPIGLLLSQYLKKWQKKVLIYVPCIEDLNRYDLYFKGYRYKKVSSQTVEVDVYIEELKQGKIDFIITTTLLERGVTIVDVQVLVIEASHPVYTKEVLIQIAGRVGRHPKYPTGEVIFLSKQKSESIQSCIETIIHLNQMNV